jgi:phytoene desaturase
MSRQVSDKHVIVTGAGPGGLTAAMILARRGCRVSVFESQDTVGGRNAAIQAGPYKFDIGPTFLMLKEVLDSAFEDAGAVCDERLEMRKLDPMYRLEFADKRLEPTDNHEGMKQEIERCFPGHGSCYDEFLRSEGKRYEKLFPCLEVPYSKASSLLSWQLISAAPHIALGRSLFDVMYKIFGNEELALAFTFQSKYLGMSPWNCPGLFAIIPYIEHSGGIYHPIGGLSTISDAMADIAREHGAEIHLNTAVERVLVEGRRTVGVRLAGGEEVRGDEVVINADFGYAMSKLFEPGQIRKYTPSRLSRMALSCSTFMLYLGVDKVYDLPHHTIFFAEDYRNNVESVFEGRKLDSDISMYVRNADVTDPTLSPTGHSSLYILVPVPNLRGEPDWDNEKEAFRELTLDLLAKRAGMTDLREHIVEERMITPLDWRDGANVYEGATFNLAHNWPQLIYLRPRNKFEEFDNCYLVGGGTHPGSGLPTIYQSGRIAANLITGNGSTG